jgi:hypothetical protein
MVRVQILSEESNFKGMADRKDRPKLREVARSKRGLCCFLFYQSLPNFWVADLGSVLPIDARVFEGVLT